MQEKKDHAIEMLATGRHTYTEIAEEVDITQLTLRRWRNDPDFAKQVLERSRDLMKERLPSIYNVLTDNALTGSHQHIKLLLDHLAKLEELKTIADQGNITFTWSKSTQ